MDFAPQNIKNDSVFTELGRFVCSPVPPAGQRRVDEVMVGVGAGSRSSNSGAAGAAQDDQLVARGCRQIDLAQRLLNRF